MGMKTKQKLLKAAYTVFGELGFFQAGITDITREAKVSLGTFYTYFQSKEDIFKYLVMNNMHELRAEIAKKTKGISDRIQLEKAGFKIFFQYLLNHPYHFRLYRQAEFVDGSLHRDLFEIFAEGYIEGLSKAMANDEIRKINPEIVVYCLMGIMDYIGMKWFLWENRELNDEFIDELMAFVQNGLEPPIL
jgi:AcrR family transcriptional regulator